MQDVSLSRTFDGGWIINPPDRMDVAFPDAVAIVTEIR